MTKEKVSSKRGSGGAKEKGKFGSLAAKWKLFVIIGILGTGTGIGVGIFFGIQYLNALAIGPGEEQPLAYSSVFVSDWASGEDLKDLCPVSMLVNDQTITESNEIYDLANYKTLVTAKKPEDINNLELDLSSYDYVIFIINPNEATDGYWARDYIVYPISGNTNYILQAKHESTDFYGTVLDRDSGSVWAKNTNGNYSILGWFPKNTETEYHWKEGGDWDYDDAWADLSTATKDKLKNENEWRCSPILFDMNDDQADHERTGDFGFITETRAIEIDFNATIGGTGTNTDLNITVDCDINYLIEYGAGADADKLYITFTETWSTTSGNFNLDFEIKFHEVGKFIIAESVKFGSITIPGRYFNDVTPTFTSLQTLV